MSNEGSRSGLDKPGKIVIISSPSGGGKTTICKKLLELHKNDGWSFSVSATTRPKRPNEVEGREYYFKTESEFKDMEDSGEFAESCHVHGNTYGTPSKPLERILREGGALLLDIDYKGAKKIKAKYPQAISIFVFPPSRDELERRLRERGTESEDSLSVRFRGSVEEMKHGIEFENYVINENLEKAIAEVDEIIKNPDTHKSDSSRERIRAIIG
ncbi:MAG: guanylate kinase [candidate division Zixibacteria bacterium]|nr:guanylate kinase [candidate division Zixibacteria bacterium]